MPRTLDEIIASLPEGERAKIEARATELIAEEMSLRELREAIGKTQTAVAKKLHVGQHAVSKIERRSDVFISTLRHYLRAIGGDLVLIARFPDRPPVCLEGFETLSEEHEHELQRHRRERRALASAP
jgi:transcriptional regulator with XRE-family HTH domain